MPHLHRLVCIAVFSVLAGCGHTQHAWQVDKWGPAEVDVRELRDIEVRDVALPTRITGSKSAGDEARWQREWPRLFADELAEGLSRECDDLGSTARGVRRPAPFVLELKLDALSVGGSAYSNGSVSGIGEIKRADGTLVVRLFASWASGRGLGEPDVEIWLDDMGMQLARWIYAQR